MVDSTKTVTVDRISNSGNAIAQEQRGGKDIHVPAGTLGDTLEVKLVDEGGYYTAKLVDRLDETQPRSPSVGSNNGSYKSELGKAASRSHSHTIRTSPKGGKLRSNLGEKDGSQARSQMSQRKK